MTDLWTTLHITMMGLIVGAYALVGLILLSRPVPRPMWIKAVLSLTLLSLGFVVWYFLGPSLFTNALLALSLWLILPPVPESQEFNDQAPRNYNANG